MPALTFLGGLDEAVIVNRIDFCRLPSRSAQTSECSTVPKASDRLACYDRITPPRAEKPVASKQKAAGSKTSSVQGTIVDALAVENATLDAKLKRICRGC